MYRLDEFTASRLQARDNKLKSLLGGDELGILGFREHIFTYQHSVVGRYMALAEHSFGTVVQRFLSKPHYIRMHYGHPDMVNGYFVKKTGGVSRGSLRVTPSSFPVITFSFPFLLLPPQLPFSSHSPPPSLLTPLGTTLHG